MSRAFWPMQNDTSNITVGASSGRVKITDSTDPIQVRISNQGTATVWIVSGDVTVAADTTNDIPILAGMVEVMTFQAPQGSPLYIAAIAAGSTGIISFTPGNGL